MTAAERLTELYVDGDHVTTATNRLDHVMAMIGDRNAALDLQAAELRAAPGGELAAVGLRHIGPAFVVHVTNIDGLLDNDFCTAVLLHIARRGGRAGVVARVYGDGDEVVTALLRRSSAFGPALFINRSLQVVGGHAPLRTLVAAAAEASREMLATEQSAPAAAPAGDVAAQVLAAAGTLVAYVREHDEAGQHAVFVAEVLRRAAETLAPAGDGCDR